MTSLTRPRAAAIAAGSIILALGGLAVAGCGSSSDAGASTASGREAAAAPREITLTPTNVGTPVIKQPVSSTVGETIIYSVSCNTPSTGQVWRTARPAPLITRRSPTVEVNNDCVVPEGAAPGSPGVARWAFVAIAPGTQIIRFKLINAEQTGEAARAVVVLTITE